MALRALPEAVVMAKPALQRLVARSMQLAAPVLEEVTAQSRVYLKSKSTFAPFKGWRYRPERPVGG